VDPLTVEVLAQHGTEPAGLAPKPVTEEMLQAADWVISLGVGEALRLPPGLTAQDWPVEAVLDEAHGRALVADLDSRAQALWVEITTSAAAWPVTSGRAPGF
jgi:protein-tyrosine-phosphatase